MSILLKNTVLGGLLFTTLLLCSHAAQGEEFPPVKRLIPPQGLQPSEAQLDELSAGVMQVRSKLNSIKNLKAADRADVEILTKAVDYALRHREFYQPGDFKKASGLLTLANRRCQSLERGEAPWSKSSGLVVRGYVSQIDGSAQPYGLEIPQKLDLNKPAALYVWLHGRGDKTTDLHFIDQRLKRGGKVRPAGAIVVHPFGRHCMGFKSAGEIDVLDVVADVKRRYNIDPDRVVLMGFSMGGAGVWHIAAHYPTQWVAASPGAGFAETAQYTRLKREDYPPSYEQKLWGAYDVPNYVRNLFNLPITAYSGEIDKQIQAARVMETAFKSEGRTLPHLIGPGMGHKYHPDTLKTLLQKMQLAAKTGRPHTPQKVALQTRTLRYNRVYWVEALALKQHWKDSRIDAEITAPREITVSTKNVTRLRLSPWKDTAAATVKIDGATLQIPAASGSTASGSTVLRSPAIELHRSAGGAWAVASLATKSAAGLRKQHGLQGPIDDAFLAPFLVVLPSGKSKHARFQQWMEFELQHFAARWRALYRGELRIKKDVDVTPEDMSRYNLIVWGDPASNKLLAGAELPVSWTADGSHFTIAGQKYDAASHAPVQIYPNPLQPSKYIVLNSGPTFREAHDRTNSLQNPKLPDWAVFSLDQPPSGQAAGKVVAAGFFDEAWQIAR